MIIRPTTPEENLRAAELFAIDFRRAMVPGTVAPGGQPGIQRWAAFSPQGEMMGSLLLTDYTIHFDGCSCAMTGFGGVNTLPPYRRSGCIRRCFETILPKLYAEGREFSYLYPFSTGYYLQFGYQRCVQLLSAKVDLLQLQVPKTSGRFRLAESRDPMLEAVRQVDQVWERQFNMMVRREKQHYTWLLGSDPAVRQEFTYVFFDSQGIPKGYTTFRVDEAQALRCSRFIFTDPEGFRGLLQIFQSLRADHRYVHFSIPMLPAIAYLLPEWSLGAVAWTVSPHGMVRVVNVQQVLQKARYQGSGQIVLDIQDPLIPENNGAFAVTFQNGQALTVESTQAPPDAVMTIGTFSALICGVFDAVQLPWLEGLALKNPQAPFDQVFYQKPLMITESF